MQTSVCQCPHPAYLFVSNCMRHEGHNPSDDLSRNDLLHISELVRCFRRSRKKEDPLPSRHYVGSGHGPGPGPDLYLYTYSGATLHLHRSLDFFLSFCVRQ